MSHSYRSNCVILYYGYRGSKIHWFSLSEPDFYLFFFSFPRGAGRSSVLWNRATCWTARRCHQGKLFFIWMINPSVFLSMGLWFEFTSLQNSHPPEDHSPISRKEFVRFLLATPTKSELRCQVCLSHKDIPNSLERTVALCVLNCVCRSWFVYSPSPFSIFLLHAGSEFQWGGPVSPGPAVYQFQDG